MGNFARARSSNTAAELGRTETKEIGPYHSGWEVQIVKSTSLLIAGLIVGSFAYGQTKGADSDFVQKASEGGVAEVKLGQLAQQKATNSSVKNFGMMMVTDHTKAGDQLKSIATQKGMSIASSLNSKDQSLYDRLSSMSGNQFDEAYITAMVSDHKEDIAEFEKEANSGRDPQIKQFAQDTLPTLREHLKAAEAAQMEVQKSRKGE
jgi:predicted outer membrane protein